MKIIDVELIKNSIGPQPKGRNGSNRTNEFQKVLNETLHKPDGVPAGRNTHSISANIPIHPAQLNPIAPVGKEVIVEHVDRFINVLENYQQKLAEPGATLKDIDRIVSDLSHQKNFLTPMLDSLPKGDELRDIVNEALVMASREILKFERGDYIVNKRAGLDR